MTNEEFKYIWTTRVCANGPWNYAATVEETALLYREKLLRFKKETLHAAIDELYMDDDCGKNLPSIGLFLKYCLWIEGDTRSRPKNAKGCPCCCNTRFVSVLDKNGEHKGADRCDCIRSKKIPKTVSDHFGPDMKCRSYECRPWSKSWDSDNNCEIELGPCPRGEGHYQKVEAAMKKKFEGYENACDFKEVVKDIPGLGEDDELPF